MTQDEIIEMARQANFAYEDDSERYIAVIDDIQDFAKLVAAKERDALVLLLRNLADDYTPSECADMICALQSLGAIRARGEA
jgi:hypothetical protein